MVDRIETMDETPKDEAVLAEIPPFEPVPEPKPFEVKTASSSDDSADETEGETDDTTAEESELTVRTLDESQIPLEAALILSGAALARKGVRFIGNTPELLPPGWRPGLPIDDLPIDWPIDGPIYVPVDPPDTGSAPSAPTISGVTVTENVRGAVIGTVSSTDPDGGPITYSVSDERFEMDGDQLKLKSGVSLDYETTPTVTVTVTATDDTGLSTWQSFTIQVTDVAQEPPEPPTLNGMTVAEDAPGAVIGTLSSTDDNDDPITYTVSDTRFEVVGDQLKLKDGVRLDHETEPTVPLTVTAHDGTGYIGWSVFDITVTDVVEDPTQAANFNAFVTDETGAEVLTTSTTGLAPTDAARAVAGQIVASEYLPQGTISTNDQFLEYRRDAKVASIVDNGEGTFTVTVTQTFGRHYFNAGGEQTYTNTDTYTISLSDNSWGRQLSEIDVDGTGEPGSGLDQSAERTFDLAGRILDATGSVILSDMTDVQATALTFTLTDNADLVAGENWGAFVEANFDADGTYLGGESDLSMFGELTPEETATLNLATFDAAVLMGTMRSLPATTEELDDEVWEGAFQDFLAPESEGGRRLAGEYLNTPAFQWSPANPTTSYAYGIRPTTAVAGAGAEAGEVGLATALGSAVGVIGAELLIAYVAVQLFRKNQHETKIPVYGTRPSAEVQGLLQQKLDAALLAYADHNGPDQAWVDAQADAIIEEANTGDAATAAAMLLQLELELGAQAAALVYGAIQQKDPAAAGAIGHEVMMNMQLPPNTPLPHEYTFYGYGQLDGATLPTSYLTQVEYTGTYSVIEDMAYHFDPRFSSVGETLSHEGSVSSRHRVSQLANSAGGVPIIADIMTTMTAVERAAPGTSGLDAFVGFAELTGHLSAFGKAVEVMSARNDGSAEDLLAVMVTVYTDLPVETLFENAHTENTSSWYNNMVVLSDEGDVVIVDKVTGQTIELRAGADTEIMTDQFGNQFEAPKDLTIWIDGVQVEPTTLYVGPSMDGERLVVGIETPVDPNDPTADAPKNYNFIDFSLLADEPQPYLTGLLKKAADDGIVATINSLITHDTTNPAAEALAKYMMVTYGAPLGDKANEWLEGGIEGMMSDPATEGILADMQTDLVATGVMIDGGTMVALGLFEPEDADLESIYFVEQSAGLQARFDALGLGDMTEDIVHVYDPEQGARRDLKIDWTAVQFNVPPPITHISDHQWEAERFVVNGDKQTWRVNARARFASVPINRITLPVGGHASLAILRNQQPGEARLGFIGVAAQGGVNLTLSVRSGRIDKSPNSAWARYGMLEGDFTFVAGGQVGDGSVAGEGAEDGGYEGWYHRPIGAAEIRFRLFKTNRINTTDPVTNMVSFLRWFAGVALGVKSLTRLDTIEITASSGWRRPDGEPGGFFSSDLRFVQIFSVDYADSPWSLADLPPMGIDYFGRGLAWFHGLMTGQQDIPTPINGALNLVSRMWNYFVNGPAPTALVPAPQYANSPLAAILPSATGAATRTIGDFYMWVSDTVVSLGCEAIGVADHVADLGLGTAYARYAAPGVTEIVSYAPDDVDARIVTHYADGTVGVEMVPVANLVRGPNDIIVDFGFRNMPLNSVEVIPPLNERIGEGVATPWTDFSYKGQKALYYVTWVTGYRVRLTWGSNPAAPQATSPFPTTAPPSPPTSAPTVGPTPQPNNQLSSGPSDQPSPGPSDQPSLGLSDEPTPGGSPTP